jgi:hypothetical protein
MRYRTEVRRDINKIPWRFLSARTSLSRDFSNCYRRDEVGTSSRASIDVQPKRGVDWPADGAAVMRLAWSWKPDYVCCRMARIFSGIQPLN